MCLIAEVVAPLSAVPLGSAVEELGISRQAVAARLKRAYRTLAERIRDERPPQ